MKQLILVAACAACFSAYTYAQGDLKYLYDTSDGIEDQVTITEKGSDELTTAVFDAERSTLEIEKNIDELEDRMNESKRYMDQYELEYYQPRLIELKVLHEEGEFLLDKCSKEKRSCHRLTEFVNQKARLIENIEDKVAHLKANTNK